MTNVIRSRVALLTRLLFTFSVAGLLAGTSRTALAAFGELDITFPYVPLGDAGKPISGVNGVQHGLGDVKLNGWTFPFAKTTFSEVMVSTDGFLTLGSGKAVCGCTASLGTDTSCNSGTGYDGYEDYELGYACGMNPPSGAVVNFVTGAEAFAPQFSPGLIAPFYNFDEDAEYDGPSSALGTISYLQGGGPGAHYLIIDWDNQGNTITETDFQTGQPASLIYGQQYQAILFEGGAIVFTYGAQTPEQTLNGGVYADYIEWIAGAYFPPADGGMGITDAGSMLGPSKLYVSGNCMNQWEQEYYDECDSEPPYENDWPQLNPAYMGELDTPFLNAVPSPVAVPGPTGPTIDISVTVTNQGSSSQAANFPIDFFLIQAGEPPYGLPSTCIGAPTALGCGFTFSKPIPAGQSVTLSAQPYGLPSPLPPTGIYNVAAVIDAANTAVMSTAPLLEIGISTNTLELGQDMTGQIQVTDFVPVKPGEFIVPLVFSNLGLEEAISVPYELNFIGTDASSTPGASGTVYGLVGLSNEPVNQDVTIPAMLQPGVYQLQLIIGAGIPTDLNPKNNTILGIQHVENGQDMTASILSVPFAIASPLATPTDFTVPVTFHNLGLQPANSIPWTLYLTGADGNSFPVGTDNITLAGLSSITQGLNGVIKTALPSGAYTLSLQIGPTSQGLPPGQAATPDLNQANNNVFDTTPVYVFSSSSDYAVGPGDLVLPGGGHAADGQVISVTRTIHNLEGPAGPCPYSYFLNPPTVTQVGDGVPVAILGPNGPTYLGETPPFGPYGDANANNTATDKIVIPAGMPIGPYNLVLALNPGNQIDDINPANNDTWVAMSLAANPLQISSPSSLPAAIVDTPYVYVLQETGASGDVSWSLPAGSLPVGLALNQMTGEISGSATEPGVYTLVVQLTAQGGTQVAVLQLPVAAGSGALQVEQSGASLPTAIVESPYLQQLQAQGGVPPYTWKSTIPSSLYSILCSTAGVLGGIPQEATDGPVQFTVVVTDAIGTTASQTLTLQVIAPGSLTITTPFLQPAVVGTQYDQPILASDGTVTGATFAWSLSTQTTLPSGIQFQEIGTPAVADLSGVPTQAGIFPVVVNLADNFGHSATRQYILTVAESPIPVPKQSLPAAIIGNGYAAQLLASSISTLSWRIFSGQLPPGLSLAPTGAISGTVPVGTVTGGYPFSAAVSDANGAESVVPLQIQVQLPAASGGGCATGTGPAGAGLLLLAMAWLSRRRRRH